MTIANIWECSTARDFLHPLRLGNNYFQGLLPLLCKGFNLTCSYNFLFFRLFSCHFSSNMVFSIHQLPLSSLVSRDSAIIFAYFSYWLIVYLNCTKCLDCCTVYPLSSFIGCIDQDKGFVSLFPFDCQRPFSFFLALLTIKSHWVLPT